MSFEYENKNIEEKIIMKFWKEIKFCLYFEMLSILLIRIEANLGISNIDFHGKCLSFVTQNDCKTGEYLTMEIIASCPICRKGLRK